MMNLLHTLRSRPQLVPRWAIFCLDLCLATVGLGLAYAIRFEFAPPAHELVAARTFLPAFLLIRALSMLVFRTYAGIIRFSGTRDAGGSCSRCRPVPGCFSHRTSPPTAWAAPTPFP